MSRLGHVLSPLLVGRDDILELAARRIDEVAAGKGQLLLISGEAGIGKTRLTAAISRMAIARGFRHAKSDLQPADRDNPAASFLEIGRTMRKLPAFGDLGGDLLDLVEAARAGGIEHRRFIVDVADLIAGAATEPMALTFEDLQWADDLSLKLVGELARTTRQQPLLLIGAYRSDELGRDSTLREWRSRLLTQRLAEDARLGRLSLDDTALMTTLILGTGLPAPREIVKAVYERTDGVPLHIEELLAALGAEELGSSRTVLEAAVPETLEDATLQRVARLTPEAQAVARAGAVIGRCFVPAVLAGIMDLPVAALDGPLQELIDHDVLDGPGPLEAYDFRHQLLRDALYGSVPVRDRRIFHARAAEFGAVLEGQLEIHSSLHFERAGMAPEAFRAALTGARGAARLSSHREAAVLYRRAVRNMPADLDAAEAAAVHEEFGRELAAVDENEAAAEALLEARRRYAEAGHTLEAALVLAPLVSVRHLLGEGVAVSEPLLKVGLAEIDGLPLSTERLRAQARLLVALAYAYALALRIEEAESMANEAIRLASEAGDEATEISGLASLVMVVPFMGRIAEGYERGEEAFARARAAGLHEQAARACRFMGATASEVFDYEASERWLRTGIDIADRAELWNHLNYMTAHLGFVMWATGRWPEALAYAERAEADGRGGITTRIAALYVEGYVLLGRGRFVDAQARLTESLSLAEPMGEVLRMAFPIWGLAETALLGGDAAKAIELTEHGWRASEPVGDASLLMPLIVTGTRARLAVGDPAAAADWLERVTGAVRKRGIPAGEIALAHAEGLLLVSRGSLARAREALESARAGWDERHRVWEGAWVRLDLAACLQRMNRWVDAAAAIREARTTAERLESAPLLTRADELARHGRGRVTEEEAWHPLTTREFEVAQLIAEGMTNAELAHELTISPKTASAHVEHILAKLGATRRAEIGAWVASVRGPAAASPTNGRTAVQVR